eukprot:CAMPEP_0179328586 /NCGR_PEP_ID=MMETSP0797-20121207/62615_1 /TAXON_ID=47934 /ORGANISM="Dinophysis acuminata, Strain DAEP01" /LENGTH=126 /DNA_ID=CAMNT_0021041069 /DNA_START=278 /DNA_END=654 /DNA_ORIENTATION=+
MSLECATTLGAASLPSEAMAPSHAVLEDTCKPGSQLSAPFSSSVYFPSASLGRMQRSDGLPTSRKSRVADPGLAAKVTSVLLPLGQLQRLGRVVVGRALRARRERRGVVRVPSDLELRGRTDRGFR